MPYTVTTGRDMYSDGMDHRRQVEVPQNGTQGRDLISLDLRLSRDLPLKSKDTECPVLSGAVEGFNIINRANYLTYVRGGRFTVVWRACNCLARKKASHESAIQVLTSLIVGKRAKKDDGQSNRGCDNRIESRCSP